MKNFAKQIIFSTVIMTLQSTASYANNNTTQTKSNHPTIISLSIPGSGSHLIMKCLKILTHKKPQFLPWIPKDGKITEDYLNSILELTDKTSNINFFWGHLIYKDDVKQLFDIKKYKVLFNYRDPRAQVSSWARWNLKEVVDGDKYLDERIHSLITNSKYYDWADITGIDGLYQAYMPWASAKNILPIKFEDLVGAQGGGSSQKQRDAVIKIAKFIGVKLNKKEIGLVCHKLFGGTKTFKGGQIDGWKEYFTKEHTMAFKKQAGQLLVDLGYEKDLTW